MPTGSYDSPTFLSQKDKLFLGLSLPEFVLSMAVAFFWFLISLTFDRPMMTRLMFVAPLTGVTLTLMFVRLSGMHIPIFLAVAVMRTFRKPSYEDPEADVFIGNEVWQQLESKRAAKLARKNARQGRFMGIIGRRRKQAQAVQAEHGGEVRAEIDKGVVEGSIAAEQWVRDAVKTVVKGG